MSFLYNLSIHIYSILIHLASIFNNKAKQWVRGRKDIFERIRSEVGTVEKIAWFHAASLGEFEQGRPVIEAFKKQFPEYKILLTFFSPSGYEIRKNYEGADYIFYLPVDSKSNAKKFIRLINPQIVIFIKYEFWFNYLKILNQNNTPVFIVSAIFRREQHFFKWYGGWFRKNLQNIAWFFVQNENSLELLKSIELNNATVSGDTRFDRVVEIAKNPKKFTLVEGFVKNSFVLLAGSTWPEDEKMLTHLFSLNIPGFKLIIAPHEIHESHILQIEKNYSSHKIIRLSKAEKVKVADFDILIIDGMGFLSSLYQYCHVAYIGGGFGKGIHNILEAVTFGKPVIFGPNYKKFAEAVELVEKGGAFTFQNETGLKSHFGNLANLESFYQKSTALCKTYIETNKGATKKILQKISTYLP